MRTGIAVGRGSSSGADARARLLADLPVAERRLEAAGIPTAVLEGGEGAPLVLLHGPGEFAAKWLRVLPELVRSHRVIAPDLPAHGESGVPDGPLDADLMIDWLGDLIEQTCPSSPALVGHVLGGAVAARFAIARGDRLRHLVLVDTLGLARFRPRPLFALTLVAFVARPSEGSYHRFMRQCSADLEGLREAMGERWEPFVTYSLRMARSPGARAARSLLREVGLPRIAPEDLARIAAPTDMIWGARDRANPVGIAEAAGTRHGWPLHVVPDCADDPARDQPQAFVGALRSALDRASSRTGA